MKGRIYRCAICGKEDDRGRTIRHFLTEHVPAEKIPYRCRLCGFRATEKSKWQQHLKLKQHQKAIELRGETSGAGLVESKDPWKLHISMALGESADIYELDKEKSKEAWAGKHKKSEKHMGKENAVRKIVKEEPSQKRKADHVLEALRQELKGGKDKGEVLREIQLMLWTSKDDKELREAEKSITPKVEKIISEGQFDDVESEDENGSQDIRSNDNKSSLGTPAQYEDVESSSDEDSLESDGASIEGVEDLLESIENSKEKKDQIIVVEEKGLKTGVKRKGDEFELQPPSQIIEVVDVDDGEVTATMAEKIIRQSKTPDIKVSTEGEGSRKVNQSKKGPADKIKQISAQGSRKRKAEEGSNEEKPIVDVKRKRREGTDKDESRERSHQCEKAGKRPREDDEIEGERAPKRMKVDRPSTPEASDEDQSGCIVLDQQCDLDDDLVKLNSHQDCIKTVTPAVGKIVRECITAVSSAITAKVANQPLPLGAVMQGVSSELVVMNQSLSSLVGKMNDLCLEKSEHRGVGVELRSIARNIDTMRTDVCHSAGAHERAAGDMARSLREFNSSTIQIKTALQSLTNQLSSHNDLLCKVLQDQTKEFRRLSNSIGGLQEDLRQGGTTCNLTRQILGIPKKEVPENKLEESRKSPKPSTSSYETYYTRKGRERYSGTHHYKYNHPY